MDRPAAGKSDAGGYSYVAVGRVFFSETRGLLKLLFQIVFRHASMRLDVLGISRRSALGLMKRRLKRRLGARVTQTLTQPEDADVCIRVHRGYKLFDFDRRTVTKIFDADVDPRIIAAEIDAAETAAALSFVPQLIEARRTEGAYKEEFVAGDLGYTTLGARAGTFIAQHEETIIAALRELVLLKPSRQVVASAHLAALRESLPIANMGAAGIATAKVNRILDYVDEVIDGVRTDEPLELVFSHGDFSLVNIIEVPRGLRVIDWEGAADRTILFDLYNCFMTELYYRRVGDSLVAEVNASIERLAAAVRPANAAFAEAMLSRGELLRRVYYAERVAMLLEREVTDKLVDVTLRSIDVFRQYDAMSDESAAAKGSSRPVT